MYVHLESILYGDINESYECVTRKCPLQGYKCAIKSIFYNLSYTGQSVGKTSLYIRKMHILQTCLISMMLT